MRAHCKLGDAHKGPAARGCTHRLQRLGGEDGALWCRGESQGGRWVGRYRIWRDSGLFRASSGHKAVEVIEDAEDVGAEADETEGVYPGRSK